MKKQAKGPKFHRGQVVRCVNETHGDYYLRIVEVSTEISPDTHQWEYGDNSEWYQESELRPLTAREAGPARGKRRAR